MTTLTFSTLTSIDDTLREEMLDLWVAVNAAGGAVGFTLDSPRSDVAKALAAHEAEMAAGGAWLVTARGEDGALAGMAWWSTGTSPLFRHVATIKRLMVDPRLQSSGVGTALMDELHRVVQGIPGVEILQLQYRTGNGLGAWYARYGYQEVYRAAHLVKLPTGEYRGSVIMHRTLDGSPLPTDDRL